MSVCALVVGSLGALEVALDDSELFSTWRDRDVVVIPTAAAFTSMEEAALGASRPFETRGARVEALMIAERSSGDEAYFVRRVREADAVVLADGSPLHARSVWRRTALADALNLASCLIAVGATASVLGSTMIDPRGGAPTTGLGWRDGLVITTGAAPEQLARTRSLLEESLTLAVVGESGALILEGATWRRRGDVVLTAAHREVSLEY